MQGRLFRRAVFLDRDGVINRKAPDGRYIARVEEFEFLPAVIDCVKRLNRAGLPVIVITNQRGVATGSITTLTDIHDWMLHQFAESGALVSAIYVCPHDYRDRCECRKPQPGMLLKAATEHNLDLPNSWMIGDSNSDVQAGKAAGCQTVRIYARALGEDEPKPNYQATDLSDAVQWILEQYRSSDILSIPPRAADVITTNCANS